MGERMRALWCAMLVAVGIALAIGVCGAQAAATTYTVSSGADGPANAACPADVCPSLRSAINAAAGSSDATVELSSGTTYTLTSTAGALPITTSMTITGAGPATTTIKQMVAGDGVITIPSGAATVSISGVTITGGDVIGATATSANTDGGEGNGGGISSTGTLKLTDDAITGDTARGGAGTGTGLYGTSGGGGVYSLGPLTVIDTSFSGNEAEGGTATDNASAGYGGAMLTGASLVIEDSTIGPDNTAAGAGGGIDVNNSAASTMIVNSTVVGNTAGAQAGGIVAEGATTLASDTFDANDATAAGAGGNLWTNSSGTVALSDTIIAGGLPAGSASNCLDDGSSGNFVDDGHNFESDAMSQCGLAGASKQDVLQANAFLAVSASANGGSTETLALLPGAPEIGAGGACTNPLTAGSPELLLDQRGLPRPASGPCDIGALQDQPPVNAVAPTVSPTSGAVGTRLTCTQGTWTGDGPLSSAGTVGPLAYAYEWLRGTSVISGATSNTYTTQAADGNQSISCRVTATGAYATASAASAPAAIAVKPVSIALFAPVLSDVSQSEKRWREQRGRGRTPVGTRFRFTLSEAASVTFSFRHPVSGRTVGGRCVAATKRDAKQLRCTRTVTVGVVRFAGVAGANTNRFVGRIGRQHLAPGRYTVVIAASTAAGSAKSVSERFTIVAVPPNR